jgi:peptidoglycan-associated lipoprotein
MSFKKFSLALLVGGAILAGCAKKPPPPPPSEPTPPKVEAPKAAPKAEAPKVDTAAMRRDRLMNRAAMVFKPIYYAYDQSSLSGEGKAAAEVIARFLQDFPEVTLRVEGHADERGTNEYNLALGERRAQSVQQYLASYGIDAGRVSVLSYGEEKPASEGKDESAWSMNRRAEFAPSY